jgi:hypothetical protein
MNVLQAYLVYITLVSYVARLLVFIKKSRQVDIALQLKSDL